MQREFDSSRDNGTSGLAGMSAPARSVHEQAADWLVSLNEAPGDHGLQQRFEAWLDQAPHHALAWVSVTDTWESIAAIGPELEAQWHPAPPVAPPGGMARLRQVLRRGTSAGRSVAASPGQPRRAGRVKGLAKTVAARTLAVGTVAACLAWWLGPLALLHATADYTTDAGEVQHLRLADGSVVELGPASAIAVDLRANQRVIRLLAGEAWFEVAHNRKAPFHVDAGEVRTTALGTAFDVRHLGAATAVSLRTGRVRVHVGQGATRDLAPGQWLRVGADRTLASGSGNPALFGAWQTGTLVVRDAAIADVIDQLRPWYAGQIVLLDRRLGQRRVDGAFDARDPRAALAALVAQAGGTVRQFTPWLLVVS